MCAIQYRFSICLDADPIKKVCKKLFVLVILIKILYQNSIDDVLTECYNPEFKGFCWEKKWSLLTSIYTWRDTYKRNW